MISMAVMALLVCSAQAFAADLKIGYADLQRALNECTAGIKAREDLQTEAKQKEEELNGKQEELKKLKDEMDEKGAVWNEDTRKAKEQEFREKSREFQKRFAQYGEEFNRKREETEKRIIEELRDVVEEVAKDKGYTFIFEATVGGILYAPPSADVTDAVIKAYDGKVK